ncbi:related to large-conductance mechanosensitive channel [Cephalotrichum gorgonifer]|uniref:Related to large-conductance mechanosensitive channel n=1 Tax=Cephalotrichum gorgonifer TaxID=2041049 RepID=A0AAE8STM8_9PEZI|nr:related to large-conductance mechanosensitive channel [Cephalotrichum gorgonifer]
MGSIRDDSRPDQDPPAWSAATGSGSGSGSNAGPAAGDLHEDHPPAYDDALPPYSETAGGTTASSAAIAAAKETEKKKAPPPDDDDITAAFSALKLSNEALGLPRPETCLAHLKLLYALRRLREDVGYSDGLWGIRDPDQNSKAAEATEEAMSRLREKRWAVYLARAVDRYEAWWVTLGGRELTMGDLETRDTVEYEKFTDGRPADGMVWDENMLVPLDVLMVWHTHMLNPRAYLEDCIRFGRRALWLGGIPWATVNDAIDTSFTYSVTAAARSRWELATGLPWENTDCPMMKSIECPRCLGRFEVEWTSWGQRGTAPAIEEDYTSGHGYGDGNFAATCPVEGCWYRMKKDTLYVSKWVRDVRKLYSESVPMPGTVLSLPKGIPLVGDSKTDGHHAFPNRLLRTPNAARFLDFFKEKEPATLKRVRDVMTGIVKNDLAAMKDPIEMVKGKGGMVFLPHLSRMAVRVMMSRYDGNHSILALDLVAAVSRQTVFIDKMVKLDWLHSPAATSTMTRLITKYTRFLDIMTLYPKEMMVPTLDVDLAWHTAQLTPSTYLKYTVSRSKKFIDHNDKVEESVLRGGYDRTSKMYQKMFGEVYSECTCWYCETVRARDSTLFGLSSHDKVVDAFHSSGAAQRCPPDNSAHVSAHSSVNIAKIAAMVRAEARYRANLTTEFERARKRAAKKGREIESEKEYYDHWGQRYSMFGPWVAPLHFYQPLYDGGCPGAVEGTGACVGRTCAGGLGKGVCGGPGGCGACGTDGGGIAGGYSGSTGSPGAVDGYWQVITSAEHTSVVPAI